METLNLTWVNLLKKHYLCLLSYYQEEPERLENLKVKKAYDALLSVQNVEEFHQWRSLLKDYDLSFTEGDDIVSSNKMLAVLDDYAEGANDWILDSFIIQLCHLNRRHAEDGVETTEPLLLLDFLHRAPLCRGYFFYVDKGVKYVGFITPIGFLVKVIQNVFCHKLDALRGHECLFAVNVPYILIINVGIVVHRLDVIHAEGKHVFIIDGVHNRIGVELIPEGLFCGEKLRFA